MRDDARERSRYRESATNFRASAIRMQSSSIVQTATCDEGTQLRASS